MNKIKQIAAVQKNMKTNDDDNNTMSSTTKDDSDLFKMKMTFSRSQTTPADKGRHVAERGYHMRLQNNTHDMTHKKIKIKHSRCFLKQEILPALLRTGCIQEKITT